MQMPARVTKEGGIINEKAGQEHMAPAPGVDAQTLYLSTLLQLEKQMRHAMTPSELGFVMANETLRLTRYRQALVWRRSAAGRIFLEAVSGVDRPDPQAPYGLYCTRLIRHLIRQPAHREVQALEQGDLPETFHRSWQEWSMEHLLWCPLISPDGEVLGGLLFFRETSWAEGEKVLLERLADAGAHAFWALGHGRAPGRIAAALKTGWVRLGFLVLGTLLMAMPVRLSVLAPVQVVATAPLVVSSPMDGVIKGIHVAPSQAVKKGDLLFSLDDTRIRNEHQVAEKALEVVRAEFNRARQKAFTDERSKADLQLLQARIQQKTVELDYVTVLLAQSRILADRDGIAVFGEASDWEGRPVAVGEKVMILADPFSVEARIDLPVADAITLNPGADIRIFLNIRPGKPYEAVLRQSGYEAKITPDGLLAFPLRASLVPGPSLPRIGLRGTAKLYGEKVRLVYFLLRKPLAAAQQFLGL